MSSLCSTRYACCDELMSDFRMRLARADDAPAVCRLLRRVARRWVMPDQPPEAVEALEQSLSTRAIRQRMEADLRFHLAFAAGALVGVASVRNDSHIVHLFVGTRYQGRGVARKLWDRLRKDCERRAGTHVFTLNAAEGAIPVYQCFGFEVDHDPARLRGKVVAVPMIYRGAGSAQCKSWPDKASRTDVSAAGESTRTASRPRQAAAR